MLDYPVSASPPCIQNLIPYVISPEDGSVLSPSKETTSNISSGSIQPPIIEVSSSRLLFHQKHGNIIFLLPCGSTTPAMVPFEFIARFIDALESFLTTPIIPTKIELAFDVVVQILSEMLDGGAPLITETDMIHEYVQPTGTIAKFLSTTPGWQGTGQGAKINGNNEAPWRRSNVRYTSNELFVDIVETLNIIIPPTRRLTRSAVPSSSSAFYTSVPAASSQKSKPLIARVDGRIFINSHLSGVPDITLALNPGKYKLEYPTFHPCVRFDSWLNSKASSTAKNTYSFIPPDGKFLLGSYEIENVDVGLVHADLSTGLGTDKNEFEVRVWTTMSRDSKAIENLSIKIVNDGSKVRAMKTLRVTTGDFNSPDGSEGEWRFPGKTPLGWNATLRGVLLKQETDEELSDVEETTPEPVEVIHKKNKGKSKSQPVTTAVPAESDESGEPIVKPKKKKKKAKSKKEVIISDDSSSTSTPAVTAVPAKKPTTAVFPTHLAISYKSIGQVPSGIKVQSLKINNARGSGEGVKPFKGVRYITVTGDYIVR